MYQVFLEWALKKFIQFNEKFQSNSSLTSQRQIFIGDLYKFFFNIYMDSDYINSTAVEEINPFDVDYFVAVDEIKIPDHLTALMQRYIDDTEEAARDDAETEMFELKSNLQKYAKQAAAKIEERFDLDDTGMLLLGFLHPSNALSRHFHHEMPDFSKFFYKFPQYGARRN